MPLMSAGMQGFRSFLRHCSSKLPSSAASALGLSTRLPPKPRVLVVGTGWGGFRFSRDLNKDKYNVTVVSPRDFFLFTPLLPSTSTGTLEYRTIIEPVRVLRKLCYHKAAVERIDTEKKVIQCRDKTVIFDDGEEQEKFELSYDYLVLACGAVPKTFGVPGVFEHAFFLRKLSDARKIRSRIVHCLERASQPHCSPAERQRLLTFVVVGGGPTSVEFVAELHDFMKKDVAKWYSDVEKDIRVVLLESSKHILGTFDSSLRDYTTKLFRQRRIDLRTGVSVKSVTHNSVEVGGSETIPCGIVVWSTGVGPNPLVQSLLWPKTNRSGRIAVNENLAVPEVDGVFAIGDCSTPPGTETPCTAQVASQQAIYLAKVFNNGAADAEHNREHSPFVYRPLASMAYIGDWQALVDWEKLGSYGKWSGFLTYLFWKSAYWTKNVSLRNKCLIPIYWLKASIFGRDVSTF